MSFLWYPLSFKAFEPFCFYFDRLVRYLGLLWTHFSKSGIIHGQQNHCLNIWAFKTYTECTRRVFVKLVRPVEPVYSKVCAVYNMKYCTRQETCRTSVKDLRSSPACNSTLRVTTSQRSYLLTHFQLHIYHDLIYMMKKAWWLSKILYIFKVSDVGRDGVYPYL